MDEVDRSHVIGQILLPQQQPTPLEPDMSTGEAEAPPGLVQWPEVEGEEATLSGFPEVPPVRGANSSSSVASYSARASASAVDNAATAAEPQPQAQAQPQPSPSPPPSVPAVSRGKGNKIPRPAAAVEPCTVEDDDSLPRLDVKGSPIKIRLRDEGRRVNLAPETNFPTVWSTLAPALSSTDPIPNPLVELCPEGAWSSHRSLAEVAAAAAAASALSVPGPTLATEPLPPGLPMMPEGCLATPAELDEMELGSEELPTVGSREHYLGTCKPCAFQFTKGCTNGAGCNFCHLCEAGEKKRRRKMKKEQKKVQPTRSVVVGRLPVPMPRDPVYIPSPGPPYYTGGL